MPCLSEDNDSPREYDLPSITAVTFIWLTSPEQTWMILVASTMDGGTYTGTNVARVNIRESSFLPSPVTCPCELVGRLK